MIMNNYLNLNVLKQYFHAKQGLMLDDRVVGYSGHLTGSLRYF